MLTGESVPVEVAPGDAVTGATVNAGGRLVVRATGIGADTQLAQMAQLVEDAQNGKAAAQRLADRISGVFVPIVIALAVATLGVLAGHGGGRGSRVHRRRRRADHRLPVRARPGHADGAAGRHRARRAARHPDQGPGGARVDPRGRHGGARQDRHRHHRADGARRRPRRRRGRRDRGTAAGRRRRGRVRAPDRRRDRPRRPGNGSATCRRSRSSPTWPVSACRASSTGTPCSSDGPRSWSSGAIALPSRARRRARPRPRRWAAPPSPSPGTARRGPCSSSPTGSSPPRAAAITQLRGLGLRPVLLTGDNTAAAQAVAAEVGIDRA